MSYGFGTGPFGTFGFGTSMASVAGVYVAHAAAENRIRVQFARKPRANNLEECGDVFDAGHFTVTPVEGTFDRIGLPARPVTVVAVQQVDELTFDLITDRPFSSWPARYTLDVTGLVDETGVAMEEQTFGLLGLFKGIPDPRKDVVYNNRDIAYREPPDGQETGGGYPIDQRNDVASIEGLAAWKARVTRCLTTRRGSFAHLPDYGVGFPGYVKQLARPAIRDSLAVEAEQQIAREPETVSCEVRVTQGATPDVWLFKIRARTIFGTTEVTVPAPTE